MAVNVASVVQIAGIKKGLRVGDSVITEMITV